MTRLVHAHPFPGLDVMPCCGGTILCSPAPLSMPRTPGHIVTKDPHAVTCGANRRVGLHGKRNGFLYGWVIFTEPGAESEHFFRAEWTCERCGWAVETQSYWRIGKISLIRRLRTHRRTLGCVRRWAANEGGKPFIAALRVAFGDEWECRFDRYDYAMRKAEAERIREFMRRAA